MTLLEQHIAHIHDPAFRKQAYTKGRSICTPACAAVHSQYILALGQHLGGPYMKDGAIINAQGLADWMVEHLNWKVVQVHELREGDTAVCKSSAGNPALMHGRQGYRSAHIFAIAGVTHDGRVWAVDNQHLGGYLRNIGPGPKTPISYCLRLPT